MGNNVSLGELESIKLSNKITVGDYLKLEANRNKVAIANFIYQRFAERYIDPIESTPVQKKHGFSIMAVCCLMIEALESFRSGYADTEGKSRRCFEDFFQNAKNFAVFKGIEARFYENIRCGILHQAETTGGWKIRRSGPLFDKVTLTINATGFLARLKSYLSDYQNKLEAADWDSDIWINLRNKMSAIVNNCKR